MQRLPNEGRLGLVWPQNVSQQPVTGAQNSTIRLIPLDSGWFLKGQSSDDIKNLSLD